MKYLLMVGLTVALIGCQNGVNSGVGVVGETQVGGNTIGSEEVTSSGIDGVYYGGDSYNPTATMSGGDYVYSTTGGNGTGGYNQASNGDFYDNASYGKNVVGGSQAPAKDRVIYFSYDSSRIDERSKALIMAHSKYLKSHPNVKVLLEGHTDSRGSRGYNVALGERRAISVLRLFTQLNVPAKQIRVISYGEENPAVAGNNENAYKRNRRVVIQY